MNGLLHFTARPMSRDKSDTLLLLLACALVLLPQAGNVPLWMMAACAMLLLWRGWVTFRGNRMPSRWLLLPVAALAALAVYAQYKTLIGREAGVAMLMLLLALKLLEMHARRDLFVALFLGYFLLLTNFFNSQTIGSALMAMLAVVAMLVAQLSFQYTGAVPPLQKRLRLVLLMVALSLPLMVVQFVFFPRIQGPLWGMPGDANTGRTGLSDTMAPGNISRLARSDEVAFRVRFIDPPPAKSDLYWRGIVLGNYDGRTWTKRSGMPENGQMVMQPRGKAIRHEVTLEPHAKRWLFALELPEAAPELKGGTAHMESNGQLLSAQPVEERLRYNVASFVNFGLFSDQPSSIDRGWNTLPLSFNPQTLAFAARLRRQWPDDMQLVNAVLRHFREEKFSYTLEPPPLGLHAVDEFLFSTRAGFCEHYSSAFVILMRAARIPARVVTGYQGGEINPVDGFMTVRQSDAHAWAEVWLQGRGWVRIDPTAAVASNRVQLNLAQTLPNPALGGLINLNIGRNSWLASLRFRWDAVTNAWNQWVLNYSPTRQRSLIQSFGFGDVDWYTMGALLLAAGGTVLAIVAWPLIRHRQTLDPLRALYGRFCQLMAKQGLAREQYEGPRDYRNRIMHDGTILPSEKKIAAGRFLEFYEAVQYGTFSASPNPANLSQLKSLLVQCR